MGDLFVIQALDGDGFYLDLNEAPPDRTPAPSPSPAPAPAGGKPATFTLDPVVTNAPAISFAGNGYTPTSPKALVEAFNAQAPTPNPMVFRPLSGLKASTSCLIYWRKVGLVSYPTWWNSTSAFGTFSNADLPQPFNIQHVASGSYLAFSGGPLSLTPDPSKAALFFDPHDWTKVYSAPSTDASLGRGTPAAAAATTAYFRSLPASTLMVFFFGGIAANNGSATISTFAHATTTLQKAPNCPDGPPAYPGITYSTCKSVPAVTVAFDIQPASFNPGVNASMNPIYTLASEANGAGVTPDVAKGCTAQYNNNFLVACEAGGVFTIAQQSTLPLYYPKGAKKNYNSLVRNGTPLYIPAMDQLLRLVPVDGIHCTMPPLPAPHATPAGPPQTPQQVAADKVAKYKSYITHGGMVIGGILVLVIAFLFVRLAVSRRHLAKARKAYARHQARHGLRGHH